MKHAKGSLQERRGQRQRDARTIASTVWPEAIRDDTELSAYFCFSSFLESIVGCSTSLRIGGYAIGGTESHMDELDSLKLGADEVGAAELALYTHPQVHLVTGDSSFRRSSLAQESHDFKVHFSKST